MSKFIGWNIFLSSSESMDRVAKKEGYTFLGYAKDWSGVEHRVYRMWKMKDKRIELKRERKRKRLKKERRLEEKKLEKRKKKRRE